MAVRGAGLRPSRRRAWAASPHGAAWTATPGVRTIVCKVLENVPRGQQVDAVDVDRLRAARHSGRGVATFLKQVWGRGRRRRRTWRQRGVPAAGVFVLYYPFGFMGLWADLGGVGTNVAQGPFPPCLLRLLRLLRLLPCRPSQQYQQYSRRCRRSPTSIRPVSSLGWYSTPNRSARARFFSSSSLGCRAAAEAQQRQATEPTPNARSKLSAGGVGRACARGLVAGRRWPTEL